MEGKIEKIKDISAENATEIQKARILHEAKMIKDGAEFGSDMTFYATEGQKDKAKKEMKYDQDPQYHAYLDWSSLETRLWHLLGLKGAGTEEKNLALSSNEFLSIKNEVIAFEKKYGVGRGQYLGGGVSVGFMRISEIIEDGKMKQRIKDREIDEILTVIHQSMKDIAIGMDVIRRIQN